MTSLGETSERIRLGVFSLLLLAFFVAVETRAENRPETSNPLSWISSLGGMGFDKGGGAFLPLSVLSSLKEGAASPMLQFVLVNSMMNKCIKDVIQFHPRRRDPFVMAKAKFEYGLCRIKKCFQQAMLVTILPQLSSKPRSGGSEDEAKKEGAQGLGLMLGMAFKKDPACDGGQQSGIDPALIAAFAGAGK